MHQFACRDFFLKTAFDAFILLSSCLCAYMYLCVITLCLCHLSVANVDEFARHLTSVLRDIRHIMTAVKSARVDDDEI